MEYPDDIEIDQEYYIVIGGIDLEPYEEPLGFSPLPLQSTQPTPLNPVLTYILETPPDKLTLTFHGDGGGAAQYVGGVEGFVGAGVSGTVILNPLSPDFLKLSVNPMIQGNVGVKGGSEAEAGPKGGGGISLTVGEHFGDPQNININSLGGVSYSGGIGLEGQVIGEAQGSIIGSVAPTGVNNEVWVDVGGDVSVFGGPGAGISGEIAVGGGYTFAPIFVGDPIPASFRKKYNKTMRIK